MGCPGVMPTFRYSIVASDLHDAEAVDRITEPVRAQLTSIGGTETSDPADGTDRPHLTLVATGGTEQRALDVAAARRSAVPWEPVVLVAHELHNSLPASLETLARLRLDGVAGRIVQAADTAALRETVGDLVALHRVRRDRVGLVGSPSEWLVASVPDRDAFAARWGTRLVDVDIGETIAASRTAAADEVTPLAVRFTPRGDPAPATIAASTLHPALVESMARSEVDAVAVRCFDFLTELETSGCVALAELNDRGVVAGCEGDVAATMAMLLARRVLDQTAWVANPASIDPVENRILLAHCTVAPSMVDDLELHTHFESGLGVGLRGTFAPGGYTVLRLGGRELDRHWFAEAELVETGASPDLCRTQVSLRVTDRDVSDLLDDPLGNHLVMIHGHHRAHLERWWKLAFG